MQLDSKLIYVVGCGRSGSTILGFCLGNAEDTLDLGEVLDFAKFEGKPNGFDSNTENYQFWNKVVQTLLSNPEWVGFDEFLKLQKIFDTHYFLFLSILPSFILNHLGLQKYRRQLEILYTTIFLSYPAKFFVDSSKYPSRLLHLLAIFGDRNILTIHLIRNFYGLHKSMRDSAQGKSHTTINIILYYIYINTFAKLVMIGVSKERKRVILYENLLENPISVLSDIGNTFSLSVEPLLQKIESGDSLQRGYIFNGNRMRTKDSIVFHSKGPPVSSESGVFKILHRILRSFFK